MVAASEIVCRVPWPDELRRAQRLIGFRRAPYRVAELVVAVNPSPRERLVGCALIYQAHVPAGRPPAPHRCHWRMLPGYRGTRTEAELLRAAAVRAGEIGAGELVTHAYLALDSDVAAMLESLGFGPGEAIEEYECKFDRARARASRIVRALLERNAIPAELRVTSLAHGLLHAVRARMHVEGIMDAFDFDRRMDNTAADRIDPDRSPVLLLGDELVGALVCTVMDAAQRIEVPARWVAPAYRNSWANALLLAELLRGEGPRVVRFTANLKWHGETRRTAHRMGGQVVSSRYRFRVACAELARDRY